MSYNNPTPVVVGIIMCGNGFIVCQRGIQPKRGEWAFPGGFVNEGETAELACTREIKEETGLDMPPYGWKLLETRITQRNQLLIFMKHELALPSVAINDFGPNEEVLALRIVGMDAELCFPLHTEMLKKVALGNHMPRSEINRRLFQFNMTGNWSVFDDVPRTQAIDVMYPTVIFDQATGETKEEQLRRIFPHV